ncbi:helix-turn-helix transcriptional regulator [Acetobacter tropicalis]|uniref:HTH cro/C1-type domain-containing protein n=1 Tax=Acetobacter tropicalis TaxID=104102 RepID=A0A094YGI1_9PROT|nr:helix-turn-helix transcriptional regulator [Acetobacter tropicalis]KAA8387070.1 helix-turn-helix transcriptional regulator [Acetobacter tropicalis]KAA8391415.1 helix-turn-helix transcriptional regulator [Acetobacter tropicalis]KGB21135.1 hypothetical protein AtDm6_3130 [Acetobacter tropicalis]MBC9008760.1 helix-turn-helix transcriptional regulator [Acetobacter tropicalis]MDO8171933.1 helix-turn-helix transcriptional regulator [Acetobacter tropicalis]
MMMVQHHAPTLDRARPRLGFVPAPALRLGASAPRGATLIDDGRQIDLEEATGRYKPNQAAELKMHRHIGKRLRQKRQERGLSLPALGKRVARSGQQIQKYEVGHDAIKAATLFQLADALGVPMAWFFEGLV